MANYNDRLPQNLAGHWYVDSACIDCDLCRETAPQVFRRDDEIGFSIVYHQPETAEDLRTAEQARQDCPVEAIGDDGPGVIHTPCSASFLGSQTGLDSGESSS